jgi:hypothetical protein
LSLANSEYACSNALKDEPAFAWWVPNALLIGRCMIAKVAKSAKYWNILLLFFVKKKL